MVVPYKVGQRKASSTLLEQQRDMALDNKAGSVTINFCSQPPLEVIGNTLPLPLSMGSSTGAGASTPLQSGPFGCRMLLSPLPRLTFSAGVELW